jgi:hypothetical protein
MSNVQFEEGYNQMSSPTHYTKRGWLVTKMISLGVVSNEKQAGYILGIIAIIFFTLAILTVRGQNNGDIDPSLVSPPTQPDGLPANTLQGPQ